MHMLIPILAAAVTTASSEDSHSSRSSIGWCLSQTLKRAGFSPGMCPRRPLELSITTGSTEYDDDDDDDDDDDRSSFSPSHLNVASPCGVSCLNTNGVENRAAKCPTDEMMSSTSRTSSDVPYYPLSSSEASSLQSSPGWALSVISRQKTRRNSRHNDQESSSESTDEPLSTTSRSKKPLHTDETRRQSDFGDSNQQQQSLLLLPPPTQPSAHGPLQSAISNSLLWMVSFVRNVVLA